MTSIEEKNRVTKQGFFASLALLIPMIFAAVLSNSSAVLADTLGLAVDTCAMFLSWQVVRRLGRGPTDNYNYGFDKLENLLALGLGLTNLVFVGLVLAQAIEGLRRPVPLEGASAAIAVNIVSIVICTWMWWRISRMVKDGASPVMDAQRRFYLMGIADSLTLAVPISLATWLSDYSWAAYIDPLTAIALCGFFIFHVWGMVSGSVYDLVDRAVEESLQLAILRVLAIHYDDYDALHGIRTRRAGGVHFIELMLGYHPDLAMGAVQQRINAMTTKLEQSIPNSVVLICPADRPSDAGHDINARAVPVPA